MTTKKTIFGVLAGLVLSASAFADNMRSYPLDVYADGMDKARGGASEMLLILDHDGAPVSAMQFMIDLEGTGLRFVQAKSCMAGLPESHKGDGALSSCQVLDKGARLMVVFSDLAGMAEIPNGYLGSVKVAQDHSNAAKRAQTAGGMIKDLGLWAQDRSEMPLSADRSPILVSFE